MSYTYLPIIATFGTITDEGPLILDSTAVSLEQSDLCTSLDEEAVKQTTPLKMALILCSPKISSHMARLTILNATKLASEEDPQIRFELQAFLEVPHT